MKTGSIQVPLEDREARRVASRATVNVAVTAGAGTGKTTLLVETVLAKLLVQGRDIRRLLMLTFTEKAANEMRLRLGRTLESLRRPGTDDERDRLARWQAEGTEVEARVAAALDGLDQAEIGTIHSFCARVLREHPIEAGVDPAFVVDEGSRFEAMFRREWQAWLDRELGPGARRRAAWLRVFEKVRLHELEPVARGLASFAVPEEALGSGAERGAAMLAAACGEMAERIDHVIDRCGDSRNRLHGQLVQIAAYLREPSRGAPACLKSDPSRQQHGWGSFAEAKRTAVEAWRLAKRVASVDDATASEATGLLADFARAFRRSYTSEGLVSFDGLLAHTRALLRSAEFPKVRESLKRRYDFILVDEFQDTDPAQCEILQFLAEGRGHAAEAREVKLDEGKLFIVGDPKQWFYCFRGADIVAYGVFRRKILVGGGREEVLRTNFRSHSGIINVVNGVFRSVIRASGDLQPAYEEIRPLEGRVATTAAQSVELVLFEGDNEEALAATEARRAEAAWIAARIKADVARVKIPDAEGRPTVLAYRHIAILFKALTDVHLTLEALRGADVPYVVEGEKYFYGTSEIVDFINLLRAIADPHDRIAVAGLLRSPLGAVDDVRLFAMRKELDYREERAGEPRIFATLRELHALSGKTAVAPFIDVVFERTHVLETAAASWHGEQAVANLLKIRQTAHALEAQGGLTLRRFTARVKESVRELEEEGESPLADETLDAVRVMSVHKAKGLEFPVVVLPDLHRRIEDRDEGEPVRFDWPTYTLGVRMGGVCDAGGAALSWLESRRRREEARRVLYVAMTRPREALILTGAANFGTSSNLGLLEEATGRLAAGKVKAGDGEIAVSRHEWAGEEPRARARELRTVEPAGEPALKALAARWRERRAEREALLATPRFTSPSRKKREEGRGKREEKREDESLRDEEGRRERAAEVGTLCHRVLQRMDFGKPEVVKLVERLATDPAVAAEARAILERYVRSAAFRRIAKAKVLARELPFLMRDGESVVQGAIDLVIREGERVTVVDYKSSEKTGEEFAEQREWYVRAVEEILGVRGAEFWIVYLRDTK